MIPGDDPERDGGECTLHVVLLGAGAVEVVDACR